MFHYTDTPTDTEVLELAITAEREAVMLEDQDASPYEVAEQRAQADALLAELWRRQHPAYLAAA